jgi:hypothetical protein
MHISIFHVQMVLLFAFDMYFKTVSQEQLKRIVCQTSENKDLWEHLINYKTLGSSCSAS